MIFKTNRKRMLCYILAFMFTSILVIHKSEVFASDIYFTEDFELGFQDWEVQKGDWNLALDDSSVLQHMSTNTEGRMSRGDLTWTNYAVQADMKVIDFNGSNRAFLSGRYTDGNNFYGVSLSSKKGGLIELRKKVNGSSTVIEQATIELLEDEWYNVKLEMNGQSLKVYLDGQLVIEAEDSSLTSGAVGMVASKVIVNYDNIMVTNLDNQDAPDVKPDPDPTPMPDPIPDPEPTPEPEETPDANVSQYSVEGFAIGVTGGGTLDESSPYYAKVTNAKELGEALKRKSSIKVVEIMNDIDLGWNVIGAEAQVAPFEQHNSVLTHPILKETGVSKLVVDGFDGLTIFSKNGARLTHGALIFKRSNNVMIRNLEFDELWEWDEATKGKYDKNDWDFITLENSSNVWIDHCTFGKAYDGIIDSKKGTSGLTISWSKFLPGEGEFYEAMFNEMEANQSSYSMYKFLRDNKLSQDAIMAVASPQKKTHLIGATEMASDNADLEVTLHHNYYLDSQDRLPRLRGGNAHAYNIVMDSRNAYAASKLIPSSVATAISNKGYSFNVTSNGAISTEGGAVLVENSVILGVKYPLRNNQKSATNEAYTGKIQAIDTIYQYGDTSYRGNSTDANSPLSPQPATSLAFSWNGFSELPYTYKLDDPAALQASLKDNVGAGIVSLNWLETIY